jgi:hypothetical protein
MYFSRTGFVSIEFLPQRQKYHLQFFAQTLFPSRAASLSMYYQKPKATAIPWHVDDAKPHHSQSSILKAEEYGFIRGPQPLHSPDPHLVTFSF